MEEVQKETKSAVEEEESQATSTQENEAEDKIENPLLREPLKAAPTRKRFSPRPRPPTHTSSDTSGSKKT